MKTIRDYCCKKCKIYIEDMREYGDYPDCPECGKPMEIYFTACNFDSYFSGSHNAEYTAHGRKFQGNTNKEFLLKKTSYKNRVLEGGYKKRGHNPEEIEDSKHEKKIK